MQKQEKAAKILLIESWFCDSFPADCQFACSCRSLNRLMDGRERALKEWKESSSDSMMGLFDWKHAFADRQGPSMRSASSFVGHLHAFLKDLKKNG